MNQRSLRRLPVAASILAFVAASPMLQAQDESPETSPREPVLHPVEDSTTIH